MHFKQCFHYLLTGKGCYGRLGLGDSSNQPIPKQLPLPAECKFKTVSSSKGSDGHTLALTFDGRVFSWGDGKLKHLDFGTLFFLITII